MLIFGAKKLKDSSATHKYFLKKSRIPRIIHSTVFVLLLLVAQMIYPTGVLYPSQVLASDIDTITFDEALYLVLANDPTVISARNNLEVTNLRLLAAESLGLPSLDLKASPFSVTNKMEGQDGMSISSDITLDANLPVGNGNVLFSLTGSYSKKDLEGSVWDDGWSINVSYPILGKRSISIESGGPGGGSGTGGESHKDQVRLAKTAVKNAEFELEKAIRRAETNLEAAYHGIINDIRKYEATQINLGRMKDHLLIVESQYSQGNASYLDLLDSEQSVKSAEILVDAAYHNLIISRMSLNKLMGRDLNNPLNPVPIGDYIQDPLLDLDEYIRLAFCHRQEPSLAEESLTNAKIELDIARSGLLPQVSLGGSFRSDGSWSVGINLSESLTKDYSAELNVKSAENKVTMANQNIKDIEDEIILEVTTAYYDLLEAEARLSLAEASLSKATATLDIRKAQYGAGATTHQDVMAAIVSLYDAETELIGANINCLIAKSKLADVVGIK
jgi:outer membrane protein TolC